MAVMSQMPLFGMVGLGPLSFSINPASYGIGSGTDCGRLMPPSGSLFHDHYVGGGSIGSLTRLVGPERQGLLAMAGGPKGSGKVGDGRPTGNEQFSLQIVGGKYKGGKYTLTPEHEVTIGRAGGQSIRLVDSAVSPRHAKISIVGGGVVLVDLGSKSGTFVGGEKIKKARVLKNGDKILIGTSVIQFTSVAPASVVPAEEDHPKSPANAVSERKESPPPECPMYGKIDAFPLPDLLQLLSASAKSGVITVRSDESVAKIYLREGQIYYCEIEDSPGMDPYKAFYRLLWWSQGSFELDTAGQKSVPNEITMSVGSLLMEGMYQMDEIRRLEAELPPAGSNLAVPLPIKGQLRDLTPEELDLFQLVLEHGTVASVLNYYSGSDLEAYTHLNSLIKKGFITVS